MAGYILRVVLVAGLAAAIVVPAIDGAARGAERIASASLTLEEPSPSASASPSATATPTATATRTPEPTRTPEATRTPERTPIATSFATPKPTPVRTPEPTKKPQTNSGEIWEALVRICIEPVKVDSEKCFRYLSAAGITLAEFKLKLAARLEELAKLQAARTDAELYLKQCIESQNIGSDACVKAWQLSGLTFNDFKAKIEAALGIKPVSTTVKSELQVWITKCLDSHELYGYECYRAWELSGVSSEDFDKKIQGEWKAREGR